MERSRRRRARDAKSQTLASSPSHSSQSSSSSDFEFTISSSSPSLQKSNIVSTVNLSSADQLFYKGKILPLHRSPRLSMVQTLLLSPSSSDTGTTSRDSASSNDDSNSSFSTELFLLPDSSELSRPSSVVEEENKKKLDRNQSYKVLNHLNNVQIKNKPGKYFSLARFSSVFRKNGVVDQENLQGSSVKRAKEAIGKYFKKMKPMLSSQKQQQQQQQQQKQNKALVKKSSGLNSRKELNRGLSLSFSDNLRYPRRRNRGSSCPSSRRSSPRRGGRSVYQSDSSAMEELQSAIQGAIAHCKNSMVEKSEQP